MGKTLQVAAATAISILWFTASALAGGGSAIGFGIAGFGIGALVGGALAPTEVYVGPPPGYYYDPYYDAYYDDPYYYGDYLGDDDPRPLSNRYRIRAYQRSETPVARTPTDAPVKTPAYTGSSVGQSEAKLKAAQAKAEKLGGVEKLRSEDVDGLNREQLKKLRGY